MPRQCVQPSTRYIDYKLIEHQGHRLSRHTATSHLYNTDKTFFTHPCSSRAKALNPLLIVTTAKRTTSTRTHTLHAYISHRNSPIDVFCPRAAALELPQNANRLTLRPKFQLCPCKISNTMCLVGQWPVRMAYGIRQKPSYVHNYQLH